MLSQHDIAIEIPKSKQLFKWNYIYLNQFLPKNILQHVS